MWRICVNFTLIAVFVLLMAAITLPFIANAQFNIGQQLEANYRWKRAGEKYELVMKLDPFNAKYLVGLGEFVTRKSAYHKDEISYLKQAKRLYEHALQFNPRYVECYLKLGESKINKNEIGDAFNDFGKALKNDPNGFNTSYLIGYSGISIWNLLDESEKELVLARLKYNLKTQPWYYEYIYPHLWKSTKDVKLLQLVTSYYASNFYKRKERLTRISHLKKAYSGNVIIGIDKQGLISRKDWQGESKNGKNVYRNGDLYWTGTVDAMINTPHGEAVVKIRAKGSQADGIWPYMVVELDAGEVGEIFVTSSEWKEYNFKVYTDGGIKVLSVTFVNDGGNQEKGEDRNLYVGKARVVKDVR